MLVYVSAAWAVFCELYQLNKVARLLKERRDEEDDLFGVKAGE